MKKSTKIWLGIATIWPVVYIFLFIAVIFSIFIIAGLNPGPHPPVDNSPASILFPIGFMGFFVLHMLTIMGTLALTVFYIIRVFKTEQLDQNMKIMWMLLLFFMGMLAQPVFWYLYIWRDAPDLSPNLSKEQQMIGPGLQQPLTATNSSREAEYFPPRQPPDWR
jgi:hypothetical protein